MSGSSNNPDEAHGNLQEDTSKDKTVTKRDIYDSLRKFSTLNGTTIIQVDATVIVGVLFFLTLTSFFEAEEGEAKVALGAMTIAIVFPFSASAVLVLWANEFLQNEILSFLQAGIGPLLFKKRQGAQPRPVNEKNFKSMARYSSLANLACFLGFAYLLFALGVIAFQAWYFRDSAAQDCGEDPERFGINETDIWQYMFNDNALAEQCVKNSTQFHMSLSECHKFIHPVNEGA
jgi:hypothetical protein